ncbi:MAG TPA: MMPL family transporter [Chitinophagaceae bacterium]
MWKTLGERILRYRYSLLAILGVVTGFMAWQASQVQLSYDSGKAIPTDNPKYKMYQEFRRQFGEDGNMVVIGVQTDKFFQQDFFNDYRALQQSIKGIKGVEDILSVPTAVTLVSNPETQKLDAQPIFGTTAASQAGIDSSARTFLNLPFYRSLLYNPQTGAWLMGVRVNRDILASKGRIAVINAIVERSEAFGAKHGTEMYLSGLPLVRTMMATRLEQEMRWFTAGSLLLSTLILLLFFRSVSATLLSLGVVIIGVLWSFGTIHLMGYKITLLTAVIPPLVVVIGIPNCIYFLNKYHSAWRETGDKRKALVQMIAKMGVVTLFCNIAAAIGFAVFALTSSEILQEFGVVAGINIMALFFISLVLIPAVLSMLKEPKPRHLKYLDNPRLQRWLDRLELWSINHRKTIYITTAIVLAVSIAGLTRLQSVGYVVDDLPKTDKLYTDLKFFERHFNGVMPLEIIVDTRRKYGATRNLANLERIDSLQQYLAQRPYIGKPLSIAEGLKFAKQAFFLGDSVNYSMPSEFDLPALAGYLNMGGGGGEGGAQSSFTRLVASFMDSTRQKARISVNMQDVGSERLPFILDSIQRRAENLFNSDSLQYQAYIDSMSKVVPADSLETLIDSGQLERRANIQLTGTSVTFLEGSRYIINGLKESIFWAFLLIALAMLYLFRSVRILLCSLLPNVIPLVITAGVMGWVGVPLKPSTVLVFSVALGIAIDITIRFLVNYKQETKLTSDIQQNVIKTIHSTGLSIIYTSIVLTAGFVIFCFSGFGGTQALGWLTSLTLVVATVANLVLLPALIITLLRGRRKV